MSRRSIITLATLTALGLASLAPQTVWARGFIGGGQVRISNFRPPPLDLNLHNNTGRAPRCCAPAQPTGGTASGGGGGSEPPANPRQPKLQ
jgi:hypothetical protein